MKTRKKKIVYVATAVDIIHAGIINILKIADKYGDVVVGLNSASFFTIQNLGSQPLSLTDASPYIAITGPDAAFFNGKVADIVENGAIIVIGDNCRQPSPKKRSDRREQAPPCEKRQDRQGTQ